MTKHIAEFLINYKFVRFLKITLTHDIHARRNNLAMMLGFVVMHVIRTWNEVP